VRALAERAQLGVHEARALTERDEPRGAAHERRPGDCWLQSDAGHHTSELRLVALDRGVV
jgi:hypothetical protein